jgi:ATP-dependent helicase HepA
LTETRQARLELQDQLEKGRDRLLEMNSFRPDAARRLVEAIRIEDRNPNLRNYLLEMFGYFNVLYDELSEGIFRLLPQATTAATFSTIPEDGMRITFDRALALRREDLAFITWDHPLVTEVLDQTLGSENGNSAFAVWEDEKDPALLLEAGFILEPIAEKRLHVDRFLPATPLRVVIDQRQRDRTDDIVFEILSRRLRNGNISGLLEQGFLMQERLPAMIETATRQAEVQAQTVIEESLEAMHQLLDHEIARLRQLQRANQHIRPEEIRRTVEEKNELATAIQHARIRMDALRLIWKGPSMEGNGSK